MFEIKRSLLEGIIAVASANCGERGSSKLAVVASTTAAVAFNSWHHEGVQCPARQARYHHQGFQETYDRMMCELFGVPVPHGSGSGSYVALVIDD